MAAKYDEAPEVAPNADYPEVATAERQQQHYPQPFLPPQSYAFPTGTPVKQDTSPHSAYVGLAPPSAYTASTVSPNSPYTQHGALVPPGKKSRATICGCTMLVFVLAVIIALLSAAVIGLAAGTGVEANRANDATNKLAQMSSSISAVASKTVTVTAASASATSFNAIDNNCSDDPDAVTGTTYTAFRLFDSPTYTIYCNKDASNSPLMSLFTADFNSCMDACASWSLYEPGVLGNSSSVNATCTGVSFIPLWTSRSSALQGGAPGNCYLKPGTQPSNLNTPNIGTECHAAVLNENS